MLKYLPVIFTALAFIFIERAGRWLRVIYLKSIQHKVSIDYSKEVILRYAYWSHFVLYILLIFFFYCMTQAALYHLNSTKILEMFLLTSFIPLFVVFALVPRLKVRVIIGIGRQLKYQNGTIHSDQIVKYSCDGYNFQITKKNGTLSKIPATLKHSEIVMAFLEDAVRHNQKYV